MHQRAQWVESRRERVAFAVQTVAWGDDPQPGASFIRAGQLAEELGFDAILIGDHPGYATEAWLHLTAVAMTTKRIGLGSVVNCVYHRHPVMLARLAADLDHISGGRVILGLGIGWNEAEFRQLGMAFPAVSERQEALDEAIQIVRGVWGPEPFTFHGRHWWTEGGHVVPPPLQRPSIPLLIAGGGEKVTLRQVARYADACNFGAGRNVGKARDVDDLRRKLAVLRGYCEEIGRPYDDILRTHFTTWLILAETETAAYGQAVVERTHRKPTPWEIIKRIAIGVYNDGFIHAGNLAFLALLALFPFFITAAGIARLLGQSEDGQKTVATILARLPPEVANVLSGPTNEVLVARTGPLLWFGAIVGLWTAASFIETIRDILRRAYGVPFSAPFWTYRLGSIGLIVAAVLLLMAAFDGGGKLPTDAVRLARIAGLDPAQWAKVGPVVMPFFHRRGGHYEHGRIRRELVKADRLIELKREAGKASAKARAAKDNSNGCSTGVAVPLQQNANQSQSQGSVTIVTGAPPLADEQKELFGEGVELLVTTGSSVGAARSFIGKLRKDVGDTQALHLVREAQRQQRTDPKAWLTKAARSSPANDAAGLLASVQRTYGTEAS